MVKYWTVDTTDIGLEIVTYTKRYGDDFFIQRLSGDYQSKLREMTE